MKFSDIIALAKAGYTPADVREFMKETEPEEKTPQQQPETDPEKTPQTQKVVTPDQATDPEKVIDNENVDNVDYKKMYDDLIKKQEDLKKSLEAAQASNLKQDASGKKEDPLEIFNKAVAEFM